MFTKQNTPLRLMVAALVLLAFYLLQSVPALGLRFMNISPELLLILSICVSFFENETFSAFFGLAAGIMNDVITENIVGKNAVFFMFVAFFVSVLLQTLLRNFFLSYLFVTAAVLAVYLAAEYLFTALFFGGIPFVPALTKIIIPKLLFSLLLACPTYYLMLWIFKKRLRNLHK